jgi:hypothetical protein
MRRKRGAVWALLIAPIVAGGSAHLTSADSAPGPSAIARDTTTCLDTLHASDSVSAVVTMRVRAQDHTITLPPDFEGLFVQEFRSRLRVPRSLALSVMHGWAPCDSSGRTCTGGVLMLFAQVYVTAHGTGALTRIRVIDFSRTPAFSDSVRTALERMSQDNSSPFLNGNDSVPLEISIHDQQHGDTVPSVRQVFRVTFPHYSLPFTVAEYPHNAKVPEYPSLAQRVGVEDSVALSFTILPDGTVDPQAVDVESAHYTDFIRSVFDKLVTTRYVPGRLGGCPVATLVGQTFVFKRP